MQEIYIAECIQCYVSMHTSCGRIRFNLLPLLHNTAPFSICICVTRLSQHSPVFDVNIFTKKSSNRTGMLWTDRHCDWLSFVWKCIMETCTAHTRDKDVEYYEIYRKELCIQSSLYAISLDDNIIIISIIYSLSAF